MPIIKPRTGIYAPGRLPGVKILAGLTEGGGAASFVAGGARTPATYTGAPTWGKGAYGSQLGGFTTSNFIDVPLTSVGSAYPFGLIALFQSSSAGNEFICALSTPPQPNPYAGFRINNSGSGYLSWTLKDDGNVSNPTAEASVGASDGRWHVAQGVTFSATDHRLYFDGALVATSTTSLATLTGLASRFAVGVLNRNVATSAFGGNVGFLAAFQGAIPSPWVTAQDILSGRFASIRPPRRRRRRVSLSSGPVVDTVKVQSPAAATGTGTTASQTFTASVAGNLLVAGVCAAAGATVTTPAGWSLAVTHTDGSMRSYLFYYANAPSLTSFSATVSSSVIWSVHIAEYSGVSATSPLVHTATAVTGGSGSSTGTLTPPAAHELLIGFIGDQDNTAFGSPSGGFSVLSSTTSGPNFESALVALTATSAGVAYSSSFTTSGVGSFGSIAGFSASGAGTDAVVSASALSLASTVSAVSVVTTSSVTVAPSALALASTIPAPTFALDWKFGVSALALASTVPAPTVFTGITFGVSALALASTVPAPTFALDWKFGVSALALASTVPAVSVVTGGSLSFGVSALALAWTMPSVSVVTTASVAVAAGSVDVSAVVPAVFVALSGGIIGYVSPVSAVAVVPPVVVTLSSSVSPTAFGLASTVPAPYVSIGISVFPGSVGFSWAVPAVSVSTSSVVSASALALASTVPAVSVSTGVTVSASALALASTVPAPTVALDWRFGVGPVVVSAGVPAVSVSTGITFGVSALALSAGVGSVSVVLSSAALPAALGLAFVLPAPTFNLDWAFAVGSLGLSGVVPVVSVSTGITFGVGPVVVSAGVPGVSVSTGITFGVGPVVVSAGVPGVSVSTGVTVSAGALGLVATVSAPAVALDWKFGVGPVVVSAVVPAVWLREAVTVEVGALGLVAVVPGVTVFTPAELRAAIYGVLSGSPSIAGAAPGGIHFYNIPEAVNDFPAVSYFVQSRDFGNTLDGSSGSSSASVSITVYGREIEALDRLKETIRKRIQGLRGQVWSGLQIDAVALQDESDAGDPPPDGSDGWIYELGLDFTILHQVAIPRGV